MPREPDAGECGSIGSLLRGLGPCLMWLAMSEWPPSATSSPGSLPANRLSDVPCSHTHPPGATLAFWSEEHYIRHMNVPAPNTPPPELSAQQMVVVKAIRNSWRQNDPASAGLWMSLATSLNVPTSAIGVNPNPAP